MFQPNSHINSYLPSLIDNPDSFFDEVFENIRNEKKYQYKNLLKYLEFIVHNCLEIKDDSIKFLHVHIQPELSDDILSLLSEFLIIRSHFSCINENKIEVDSSLRIELFKEQLRSNLKRLSTCPVGASGNNGGNKLFKKWIAEKNKTRELLNFYEQKGANTFLPRTLFNCQVGLCKNLSEHFSARPFAANIKEYNNIPSSVILNTEKDLNELDGIDTQLINHLNTVILFDTERKAQMREFSKEEICKWNNEFGTAFSFYLLFSCGNKENSLRSSKSKIEAIHDRFKLTDEISYTILASEIDLLTSKKTTPTPNIDFIGYETSSFWDTFLIETSIRGLYELRSIKLMNLYSLCFSSDIKNYIIDGIFNDRASTSFLSSNTAQALDELNERDLEVLKDALTNTLDLIIQSELHRKATRLISDQSLVIIDEWIIKDNFLKSKLSIALSLRKSSQLISWSDYEQSEEKQFLFLSYRDPGRNFSSFYPNIYEFPIRSYHQQVHGIYLNFFFKNNYEWSKFNYNKDLYKILSHPIRQHHFKFSKLSSEIEETRPSLRLNIDWHLEDEYSSSDNRESFRLKLKNQKPKLFNGSDLFILSNQERSSFRVDRISNLIAFKYDGEEDYLVQNLESIQDNINIYDGIVDTKQQEEELRIISQQFDLPDDNLGRLWKILLKTKASNIGEYELYQDLKKHLEASKLSIVSFNHFHNTWINPSDTSLTPRGNKVFRSICKYLLIPDNYVLIMYRLKNKTRSGAIQATKKMNQLLKDLFNDSCFNADGNPKEIIKKNLSYYKENHPLIELGINEDFLLDNLVTLVELIKPELSLLEVESIEKVV